MPVAEALSVGVPVICSDIPAHHEVGGTVPDYVDPLDGPGWKSLIQDFAISGPAYQAQQQRMPHWHEPTWAEHMEIVGNAIAELSGKAAPG